MIRLFATLISSSVLVLGCASKPAPKSTTTVHTETNTKDDQGDDKSIETKETVTEMPDGSKKTQNTQTTNTVTAPTH